jgi:hypothetical protein
MSVHPTARTVRERHIVDDALLAYVVWREACAGVWDTYECWAGASSTALDAYTNYRDALDREEAAARDYAVRIDRVRDLLEIHFD